MSGYAISWIRSYLTDRSSFVKIDSSSSPSTTILTGVPQGSVLGPLLFVLFISPIANVMNPDQSNQNNTVSFHKYADDTQLYIGTNSSMLTTQIASIESCTQRVHNWLLNNGLHLNPSKSEAIVFYNPRFWGCGPDPSLLLLWRSQLKRSRLLALQLSFKHQLRIWVFTMTQKCPLISRCPKHARLVISIFALSVTFVLLLLLRLQKP